MFTDSEGNTLRDPRSRQQLPGLRVPRSRSLVAGRARPSSTAAAWTASCAPHSDAFAIGYYAEHGPPVHALSGQGVHRASTASSARCSPRPIPNREYMHSGPVLRDDRQLAADLPVSAARVPGHARSSTRSPSRRLESLLLHRPSDLRPVGASRPRALEPGPARTTSRRPAGTLPALSFVDPAFNGEDQGTSGDEHPHGDVRVGQAFIADVVHVFIESPQWQAAGPCSSSTTSGAASSTTWSRRGCPTCARAPTSPSDFGQMGFRIPGVLVSRRMRAAATSTTRSTGSSRSSS